MDLSRTTQAIVADLEAAAELGDEELRDAARRLGRALAAAVRVRLLEALGEVALELDRELGGHVELRVAGGDVQLVYVPDEPAAQTAADDELTARITLRLPEGLKGQAEAAAAREGISTNTWLVRAVAGQLHGRAEPRRGRRLRGFAQS